MLASWNREEDAEEARVPEAADARASMFFSVANIARRGVDHHQGCLLSSESTSLRNAPAEAASSARATRINPDASIARAARCDATPPRKPRGGRAHENARVGNVA